MTEFTKPKYKNLIKYLHDRNHYKDVDKFNIENKETLLSNFTLAPVSKDSDKDGGKCFCGKKLKNVYYVYCILTNEIISVGGNCKTLFSSKKKNKEIFIGRTIELFKNGLGFEPIFSWNSFIGKALESWLKTHTLEDLENIRRQYKDYGKITSHLNLMIKRKRKEEKEKWSNGKCMMTIKEHSKNKYDWNFWKEKIDNCKCNRCIKKINIDGEYNWFCNRMFMINKNGMNYDKSFYVNLYPSYLHRFLTTNYHNRISILTEWFSQEDKTNYNHIHEMLRKIEEEKEC